MGLRRKKPAPPDRIFLGKITKPHALNGELKYQSFGGDPWLLEELGRVHVEGKDFDLELESIRGSVGAPILKFKGVDTRTQSEELVGLVLWVEEKALPPLEENEFYESDFLFSRVVTEAGEELGRVDQIIETGATDVLVIRNAQGEERLVPAHLGTVKEVRKNEGVIVLRTLEEEEPDESES